MGWSQEVVPADRAFHVGPLASVSMAENQIRILEIEYSCRRSDVTLNEEKLRQNMRSNKGGLYSQQVVNGDIESLYQTGDYANVQISTTQIRTEDGEQGVRLNVIVDPRMRVSEVEVKRRGPDGELDDHLSLKREELMRVHPKPSEMRDAQDAAGRVGGAVWNQMVTKPGEILREDRLFRDAVAMEDFYRDNGYKDVRITYKEVERKGEEAKVIFEVEEGRQGFIREIRFLGNKEVGTGELRKLVKLKPAGWLTSKEESNCLRVEKLQEDLGRLKDLYLNKGFLDVQVTASVDVLGDTKNNEGEKKRPIGGGAASSEEDLSLLYRIVEGQRYGVDKISVSGNTFFSENDILKELRSNSKRQDVFDQAGLKMIQADGLTRGRAYSVNGLQASIETLQNMYGRAGFREVRVEWNTEPSEKKGELDVHFKILEGERFYVDKVIICGNILTKDEVIRREILLKPGDVFDTELERGSKKNLERLNLFSSISTWAEETDSPNQQKLIFSVLEKPEDITFGAGLSFFWSEKSNRELFRISFFPAIIIVTGPKQFADWKGNLMKSIFRSGIEEKPLKKSDLQVE